MVEAGTEMEDTGKRQVMQRGVYAALDMTGLDAGRQLEITSHER